MKTYSCKQAPFKVFGVHDFEEKKTFYRLPESIYSKIPNLKPLAKRTPGARIGFKTDAKTFTVRMKLKTIGIDIGMSLCGAQGSCVLVGERQNSVHLGVVRPTDYQQKIFEKEFTKSSNMEEVTIWLPRNEEIDDVEIDLPNDATVLPPTPYKHGPALFYGSSITEGACSCLVTTNYVALLSRWLDMDFYNFGFSGNAKAEPEMADFLSKINCSLFVLDYDHNAPTEDFLRETHQPFFERIRNAHPDLPILMLSRPNFYDDEYCRDRRETIRKTYLTAKANGDNNVYFIDGEKFFGEEDRTLCTIDTIHPTDLGFYRMAKVIYPVMKEILKA